MISLAFFLAASAFYLHYGLVPGRIKDRFIQKIEEITRKKVTFDKALVLPFEGFSLYNLKVAEKDGRPVFSAKKFSVNVRILPFIKENKIVISNLALDRPVYSYVLNAPRAAAARPPPKTKISGQIEVPLIPAEKKFDWSALEEGPDAFLPENVTLEQIEIANGFVEIRPDAGSPPVEEIRAINVRMGFQKPPFLTFQGSFTLGENAYAAVSLRGAWDLEKAGYEFYFHCASGRIPDWLAAYQKNHFLVLKKGAWVLDAHLKSAGEERCLFRSQVDLRDAAIAVDPLQIAGRFTLDASGVFNFYSKQFERYKGTLTLAGVDALRVSKEIPALGNIRGEIRFQPDLLLLQSIEGRWQNAHFRVKGSLKSFRDLLIEAEIHMNSSLGEILSLLPAEQKKLAAGYEIRGACRSLTTVSGSLKKIPQLRMEHKLLLEGGSITGPDKKLRIGGIFCSLGVDGAGLSIRDGRFVHEEKNYTLNAWLPNKSGAAGNLELGSDDMKFSARYLMSENRIAIQKAAAETHGARAFFEGSLLGLQSPLLDIRGEAEIDLEKAQKSFAKNAAFLKDAGLGGAARARFTLKGAWKNPLGWDLKVDAQSPALTVKKNLRLEDFEIQIRMRDKIVNVPYLRARTCRGTIGGRVFFDLSTPKTFFDGRVSGSRLDLGDFSKAMGTKENIPGGTALFQVWLRGFLKNPETFHGHGALDICDGKLFQTDLFKPMGELPFVKVEGLDRVVFKSLSGTFKIHEKKIWTQDLSLFSDTVDLSLKGSAGFDKNLDMVMDIQYSKDVLRGAEDTGGLAPFMVREAGNFISQYRVGGTIEKPVYDKLAMPPGILQAPA
ncbi:MAG: hypothetical protein HYZ52_07370 [Candidatus Omnitrophica bacterium]|nr:hypothetical protein [Candidatus Omnitrophota bacterium]